MKRQATAILLPMEKSNLVSINDKLYIAERPITEDTDKVECKQLIIVDDSKIKKDNHYIIYNNNGDALMYQCRHVADDRIYYGTMTSDYAPNCKKIIAAYPLIEGIPPVSPSFITSYADANGKGEVWVEYGGEFMLSVKNSTFAKYSTFVGNPNYGKVVLDPNGCAVLELREEKAAIVLGENGNRIVAHLKSRKESLQKIVDAEAGRDEDAAVAAYHVSMNYLIEGKLTVARREDYRWGFYEGTQWQKNRPVAGNQREAVYTKEDMKLMWEAGVDFGAEVDGGYDGVKFDVTLDRITKSKAAL